MVKHAFIALSALCLCSCATQRAAPRFDRPSTAAIEQSHKAAIASVKAARQKAVTVEKQETNPALKLQIQSLSGDLDNALSELNTSEGARQQLDVQLGQQTAKANALADSFDKSQLQITALKQSRHKYVELLLVSMLVNIACLGWIFRKPILLLASGL